jgi:hypothetical protein
VKDWRDYFNERIKNIHPPGMSMSRAARHNELVYMLCKRCLEAKRDEHFARCEAEGMSFREASKLRVENERSRPLFDVEMLHYIECAYLRMIDRWRKQWPDMTFPPSISRETVSKDHT